MVEHKTLMSTGRGNHTWSCDCRPNQQSADMGSYAEVYDAVTAHLRDPSKFPGFPKRSARSQIVTLSRLVVREWTDDDRLREALRGLRPGFARLMDELTDETERNSNQIRIAEKRVEGARVAGAFAHEICASELVR